MLIISQNGDRELNISLDGVHDWCIRPSKNDLGPCLKLELAFTRGKNKALSTVITNLNLSDFDFNLEASEGVASIIIDDLDQVWDEKANEEETK